jgi:hypothetical protein
MLTLILSHLVMQNQITPITPEVSEKIVNGFKQMAFSRSLVRLSFANYFSGDYQDARLYYRQDRNKIRRQTRLLEKAGRDLFWRSNTSVAFALLNACKGERLHWNNQRQDWEYTTGQYTPTEIRFNAYRVVNQAIRFLKDNPSV